MAQKKQFAYNSDSLEITANNQPDLKDGLLGSNKREWLVTIDEEYHVLQQESTWVQCDEQKQVEKILPSHVIFKLEEDSNGSPAGHEG